LRPKTPNHPAKHHRRFHSDELMAQRKGLREEYRTYKTTQCAKVDEAKGDTAKFFTEICHLKPFTYQLELAELYWKKQFLAFTPALALCRLKMAGKTLRSLSRRLL
jgi:hypothetical protein